MTKTGLLKTAKPIIFNAEMAKAIQDGRKTETRRVIKNIPAHNDIFVEKIHNSDSLFAILRGVKKREYVSTIESKYTSGDIIYIKETFNLGLSDFGVAKPLEINYRADGESKYKWMPSSWMRVEYARTFLRVAGVRAERLQDISIDDCCAEIGENRSIYSEEHYMNYPRNNAMVLDFMNIWDSVSKDSYKWKDNPYVFVYKFEVVEYENI